MNAIQISPFQLSLAYLLLIFPAAVILWYGVGLMKPMLIAAVRMTVQLLLVGLYLQVIFDRDNPWLNGLWLGVMLVVADVSILRHCGFRLQRFLVPVFLALTAGILIPLLLFVGLVLSGSNLLHARFVIPIGGMILGNCLRANIVGIGRFYQDIRKNEKLYLQCLAFGATRAEATRPFVADAFQAAMAPTIATMATIGLVSLPGMMTGVILGGTDPGTAIMYQIAITLSILSGTAITIFLAVQLTARHSFDPYGILRKEIFADK
ncbi:MAG: ABC transporter permease [Phycisphaerae bacterium]|nr:ABC transporter permease [Phycisphaerae bacterium]